MASSSGGQGTGAGASKSARLASQRKVMDEATRRRRARKALESLEQVKSIISRFRKVYAFNKKL